MCLKPHNPTGGVSSAQPRNSVFLSQHSVPLWLISADSYRSGRLSANLIQAMRDYFGAHTYHKLDADGNTILGKDGEPTVFHTEWMLEGRPEVTVE